MATQNNLFLNSLKFITKDIIGDILYFPLWWYSVGLIKVAKNFINQLISLINGFSLPILFRSLLKPMYGDYSKSGRIISFFMRIIHLTVLSLGVLVWSLVLLVLLLAWLIIPVLIVYNIIIQIFGPF